VNAPFPQNPGEQRETLSIGISGAASEPTAPIQGYFCVITISYLSKLAEGVRHIITKMLINTIG
jgi:hypothetical protein